MGQRSLAKVKFTELGEVVLFVKNLQKCVHDYWRILGIGPWDIYSWEYPVVRDLKYRGKPAESRERIALAQMGTVSLELIEHVDGDSFYEGFISEHGEGLHQLDFNVEDVEHVAKIWASEGFPCLQSGCFGDNGAYAITDTKPLHVLWEACHMANNMNAEPGQYLDIAKSPAKVRVNRISKVSLVVKDIEKSMQDYWDIFAIGPWGVFELGAPILSEMTYRGKPAQFSIKVALAQAGGVQLELCQPVGGDSLYREFLIERGEGPHHIEFLVSNINETTRMMNEEGFPTLMSGRFSEGGFAYFDTFQHLKCIWKAFQPPKTMQPSRCYP